MNADKIRDEVSRAYTGYLEKPMSSGCGCSAANPSGYAAEALADVPADAAQHSFGCGDPLSLAGVRPGDTVVDLGSGAGLDLVIAARRAGPTGRAIGVDMTDAMIERARANIARAGLANAEVRKGLIEALPVESGSVDWVISNCVVNLSPEKAKVFAEIARVLKPGGQMLISDVVVDGAPEWLRPIAALYSACVAGAVSEADYLDGLRRAGLEAVEVRARLAYDVATLEDLIRTEAPGLVAWPAARMLAGKVKSVKVYARKPGGGAAAPQVLV